MHYALAEFRSFLELVVIGSIFCMVHLSVYSLEMAVSAKKSYFTGLKNFCKIFLDIFTRTFLDYQNFCEQFEWYALNFSVLGGAVHLYENSKDACISMERPC